MNRYEELKNFYDSKYLIYQNKLWKKEELEKEIFDKKNRLNNIESNILLYTKTIIFLQKVSEELQKITVEKMEGIITDAIQEITENENLFFKVIFSKKRNVINTEFKLYDKLIDEEYSMLDSFGGTISDIISTVLRIVLIELYESKNDGPIVLDENGKWINGIEYQRRFSKFLLDISNKLDRQILLISQKDFLTEYAMLKYKITKENDISKCKLIDGYLL